MIIHSLLDTDLYKFTMMQVVLHHFPGAQVEYQFKCRTPGTDLTPYVDEISQQVSDLCGLRFTQPELDYLRGLRFIKSDFVDFLALFQLNTKYIRISCAANRPGEIEIAICGPWLHTILFEVPVLAIVNEIYFRHTAPQPNVSEGRRRLRAKIQMIRRDPTLSEVRVADYGTRRRFSRPWQDEVLQTLQAELRENLAGTSNVLYAFTRQLTPLGTMAHEYLQACQSLGPRLRDSQTFGFETWAKEYRGDLGIALSDVYGMDAFLRDFDLYFCKLFDGARHDSGDPIQWGERLIAHYDALRVDPRAKTLVFSDALTFGRVIELYRRFNGRARIAFGVGTNLTNDLGYTPLQIVIKMVRCNGQPVAKVTDSPEKNLSDDPAYLAYLKQVFQIQ
jgi:nicotinate phosphoribosyltransferase